MISSLDMASTVQKQSVKLRLACDNCSAAKVKCDKKQPACDRCANNQVPCTYSASRRHGKQSWQKKLACERRKAMAAAAADAVEGPARPLPIAPHGDALMSPPSTLLWDGQSWDAVNLSFDLNGENQTTAPSITFNQGHNELLDPMQYWVNDDFANYSLAGFGSSQAESHRSIGTNETSSPASTNPQSIPTSSSSNQATTDRVRSQDQAPPIHDCEARAVAVLRSLHHCPTSQVFCQTKHSAEAWVEALGAGGLDLVPSFDKVLHANKAALNSWSELMKCSCAQCPHLTFLYVSILSKVLFWYRVAATGNCPVSGTTQDMANSNGSRTSWQPQEVPPPRVEQFGVQPTQIQMGCHVLDHEDQANLRRVILLRELRKVEKVVEEMTNVQRTMDDDTDDAAHYAVKWSGLGISRIRDELQEMIRKVKECR